MLPRPQQPRSKPGKVVEVRVVGFCAKLFLPLLQVVSVEDGLPTWVCQVLVSRPTLDEAVAVSMRMSGALWCALGAGRGTPPPRRSQASHICLWVGQSDGITTFCAWFLLLQYVEEIEADITKNMVVT